MPESLEPEPLTTSERILHYRLLMTLVHWGVVVFVAVAVLVLRIDNKLDNASVTALYGIVLGHAGTVLGQRVSSRFTDQTPGGRRRDDGSPPGAGQ